MDSLYGGRPGTPFVIKKGYESLEDMESDFAKGVACTDVLYGEYCIIDTKNKNNKSNGCIYRRGYTAPEYIGQIVGPKGGLGNLKMATINEVAEYVQSKNFIDSRDEVRTDNFRNYPTYDSNGTLGTNWLGDPGKKKDKGYPVSGLFKKQDYKNDMQSDVAIQEFTTQKQSLVPGKDGENFNDSIRWNYCTVRTTVDADGNPVDDDLDTTILIGFEFPYSVFEFEAKKVEHYQKATIEEQTESLNHPYYWKYLFSVPKGVHGQDLVSVRIEEYDPTNNKKHKNLKNLVTGEKVPTEYIGYKIWICTLRRYDEQTESNPDPIETDYYICKYEGLHGQDVVNVRIEEYQPNGKHKNLKKIDDSEPFPEKEGRKIWICTLRDYTEESTVLQQKPVETDYYICEYTAIHGQDATNIAIEEYKASEHSKLLNLATGESIPQDLKEGQKIWTCTLKDYTDESDVFNRAPKETKYYIGKYEGYHGQDIDAVWKEKYVKNKYTGINWQDQSEPPEGTWVWFAKMLNYDNVSSSSPNPEEVIYFLGRDTSVLLHKMWKEQYLSDGGTPKDKINWNGMTPPEKDVWIWLYSTKESINDENPQIYYAGVDNNITYNINYTIDKLETGDGSYQDYLDELNKQGGTYEQNSVKVYSDGQTLRFLVYRNGKWEYGGQLGIKLTTDSCSSFSDKELGLLGKL